MSNVRASANTVLILMVFIWVLGLFTGGVSVYGFMKDDKDERPVCPKEEALMWKGYPYAADALVCVEVVGADR